MIPSLRSTDQRTVHLFDGVAVFWVVLWLVISLLTAFEIWQLSRLSTTAEKSATAIDRAGEALQSLGELPFVGDTPTELGDQVRSAADEIDRSADETKADVRRLSVLLGLAVFLIPVSPILGLYLPLRMARHREVAAIRDALRGLERDDVLEAYLAQRAVQNLSYAELRAVSRDPGRDLDEGRYGALAAAELERLGLDVPPRLAPSAR